MQVTFSRREALFSWQTVSSKICWPDTRSDADAQTAVIMAIAPLGIQTYILNCTLRHQQMVKEQK